MLTRLTIKNYALIEELKVDFKGGFNIIIGETGAGKSIILGALGLILGNRAELNSLRDKSLKCIVEGVFDVQNYGLESFFEENDLDYDHQSIFRREITPTGKSRAFINDTPVNLKLMQEAASRLIDIHSQHQSLELGNRKFQLQLVDIVAGIKNELANYKKIYNGHKALYTELEKLKEKAEKEKADFNYFEFQFKQLSDANLVDGEQGELEEKLELLSHAEEIKVTLFGLESTLDGENASLLAALRDGSSQLSKIIGYLKAAEGLADRLESSYIELKDIAEESARIAEAIEFNPQLLEQVNERLDLIYSLQQKHHVSSITELCQIRDEFEKRMNEIFGFDEEISKLEIEVKKLKKKLFDAEELLSKKRKGVFHIIETKVVGLLSQLGMPKAKFQVSSIMNEEFSETGRDAISFLFSANKDGVLDEISKIASGGETSRLMLAIKSLISKKQALPTIVFDEIDAGISGEVASKMGKILKEFSSTTQVLNITHLPQIAGRGDNHYLVFKEEKAGHTLTFIRELNDEEKISEIATLVGGANPAKSAINAAKELLQAN